MAIKTISLELDAYERLKAAKRSERESFSSVVRRARFDEPATAGALLAGHLGRIRAKEARTPDEVFEYWERSGQTDDARISPSPWDESR